jgi:hypothetical protein
MYIDWSMKLKTNKTFIKKIKKKNIIYIKMLFNLSNFFLSIYQIDIIYSLISFQIILHIFLTPCNFTSNHQFKKYSPSW